MKVSIITVTYNSSKTIRDTLASVENQTYNNIEHIIVDGASKDETCSIAQSFLHVSKVISEPDNGIYDAMNKGISAATGDIVGILNSDDFYPDAFIIEKVVNTFRNNQIDSIYGDVLFVNDKNLNKPVRYYSSEKWEPNLFAYGYMPAHPSFFVKREHYKKLGLYKTNYKISADYELLIRFLFVNKISFKYIQKPLVYMRTGGASTRNLGSIFTLNKEIIRACKENGISTNMMKLSLKFFSKFSEFINPQKRIPSNRKQFK